MEKEPIIAYIGSMLKQLGEESIRAIYMIVKALYNLTQSNLSE